MAEIDIFSPAKKYDVIYADPPWRYQDKNAMVHVLFIMTP